MIDAAPARFRNVPIFPSLHGVSYGHCPVFIAVCICTPVMKFPRSVRDFLSHRLIKPRAGAVKASGAERGGGSESASTSTSCSANAVPRACSTRQSLGVVQAGRRVARLPLYARDVVEHQSTPRRESKKHQASAFPLQKVASNFSSVLASERTTTRRRGPSTNRTSRTNTSVTDECSHRTSSSVEAAQHALGDQRL